MVSGIFRFLRREYDPEAEEEDGGEIAETTSEEEAAEEVPEMTKEARRFIREDEEPVCGADGEGEAVFFCDGCGEGVFPGGEYTEARIGAAQVRYCEDCSRESATLLEHMEFLGIRFRSARA